VATAVFDHSARPVAAISVSGPTARILHAKAADLGALLVEHAAQVSAALGHEAAA
jgi:IclR family acetate operon transcriptional repressor